MNFLGIVIHFIASSFVSDFKCFFQNFYPCLAMFCHDSRLVDITRNLNNKTKTVGN